MAEQWYYSKQGQRTGPVSEEQLKQLASSGQVQPTDLVWKQGMPQWDCKQASFFHHCHPTRTNRRRCLIFQKARNYPKTSLEC